MDAVVMCGGQGTRLDVAVEKPLYEIAGEPMVCRVLDALEASAVDSVYGAVSPATPATHSTLAGKSVETVETPGTGYVADLQHALEAVETPVVTVAADLPLIDGAAVDSVLDAYTDTSVSVYTPAAVKAALGLSYDITVERDGKRLVPSGINIVDDREETIHVTEDTRFAVNVNRQRDGQIAEALL